MAGVLDAWRRKRVEEALLSGSVGGGSLRGTETTEGWSVAVGRRSEGGEIPYGVEEA